MLKRIAKTCIRVLLALSALLLAGVTPALAAEVHQGDTVVIGPDQVINDDVYAFGTNIQLMGPSTATSSPWVTASPWLESSPVVCSPRQTPSR